MRRRCRRRRSRMGAGRSSGRRAMRRRSDGCSPRARRGRRLRPARPDAGCGPPDGHRRPGGRPPVGGPSGVGCGGCPPARHRLRSRRPSPPRSGRALSQHSVEAAMATRSRAVGTVGTGCSRSRFPLKGQSTGREGPIPGAVVPLPGGSPGAHALAGSVHQIVHDIRSPAASVGYRSPHPTACHVDWRRPRRHGGLSLARKHASPPPVAGPAPRLSRVSDGGWAVGAAVAVHPGRA